MDAAGSFGPFFATEASPGPGWLPFESLLRDSTLIEELVSAGKQRTLARLGVGDDAVEERVIASLVFLDLAARVAAPAFGSVVSAGICPRVDPATVYFRPALGGPIPLAITPRDGETSDLADHLLDDVIRPLLEPLLESFANTFSLSLHVLWGDTASAVAGAARAIALTRPDLTAPATALAREVLTLPPLTGTVVEVSAVADAADEHATADHSDPAVLFRRRSCCLYYRIPGSGICSDCVLAPRRQ